MYRANRALVLCAFICFVVSSCSNSNESSPGGQGSSSADSSYADAWKHRDIPAPSATVGRTVEQVFGEEIDEYPSEGVVLGQGWNRGFGVRTINQCVEGTESIQQGGTVTLDYHYIFDSEQLQSLLSISAHGGYGGGSFGVHASSTYTQLSTSDRTQTHILGTAQSDKGATFLTDGKISLQLTQTAKAILNSGPDGPKRFLQVCGDGFVSSIRIGGQLSYLFDQATLSTSDKKSLTLSVSASGWGASGGVDVSTSTLKDTFSDNKGVHVFQSGGKLQIPTDMKAAVAHIEDYGDYPSSEAVPYRIVVTPYSVVAPSAVLIDTHAADIRSLSVAIDRTKELENVYNNALADSGQFYLPFTPKKELANDFGALLTVRKCLEQILLQCRATGDCDFNALTRDSGPGRCPASALTHKPSSISYTPEQLVRIMAMLPGKTHEKSVALVTMLESPTSNLLVGPDKSGARRKVLTATDLDDVVAGPWSVLKDTTVEVPPLHGVSRATADQIVQAMSANGYALTYFNYLARAPLKKNQQDLSLDELQMAVALCAARLGVQGVQQPNCGDPKNFAVTEPADDDPRVLTVRLWVIYGRVYPASQGACEANENGVLCKDIRWINKYVLKYLANPLLTQAQNFQVQPSAPTPSQSKPDPFPEDPCFAPDGWEICPTRAQR